MNFDVIHTIGEAHFADLMRLYRGEWWSRDRQEVDVRRMLAATDALVGIVEPGGGKLVGFTRILTDGVYKAFLFDVIVEPEQRGSGLGRALLEAVSAHPRLQAVEHVELYCKPEHVAFYEKWGFTPVSSDLCFMRCDRSPRSPAMP